MSIAASIYVDNQRRYKYPIEYVLRNLDFCDAIYLFGSDAENKEALDEVKGTSHLRDRIQTIDIGVKVKTPMDISEAQNKCAEFVRGVSSFDYHLSLQADTALTNLGVKFVRKFAATGDPDRPVVALKISHVRLHTHAGRTHFGIALIGKGSDNRKFVGDGAYTEAYWVSSDKDDIWHAIDISYLSIEGFIRKMDVRASVWKDSVQAGLFWEYKDSPKDFLKAALRDLVYRERCGKPAEMVSEKDSDYMEVVKYFKLEEERALVERTLAEVLKEGPETCLPK